MFRYQTVNPAPRVADVDLLLGRGVGTPIYVVTNDILRGRSIPVQVNDMVRPGLDDDLEGRLQDTSAASGASVGRPG